MVVPYFRNNLSSRGAPPELVAELLVHADSWQCSAPNSTQSCVAAAVSAAECLRSPDVCVLVWGGRNQARLAILLSFWLGQPLQHVDCCI